MTSADLPEKWLVIGAGPGGLIAARAMRRRGIDLDIFERHSAIGGVWDIDNPGSAMYESCNFITSRDYGGFVGYPMPEDYPDYPRWDQILDYVRDMAADYGLDELVTFDTNVVSAEPVPTPDGTFWRVRTQDGTTHEYRGIVYAAGHEWKGYRPEIPGIASFPGRVLHSSEYRSAQEFVGHRVIVIGAGNSGVDIASDAAFCADAAFLSTRRGYWFLPKQLFGLPVVDIASGNATLPGLSMFGDLRDEQHQELLLAANGDLTRFGLPAPDHEITATHPIVSNTVIHYLAHGRLKAKRDVARVDGDTVHFVDGSTEQVDTIVLATGYDVDIPILGDGLVEYVNGRPTTHLFTFFPGLDNFYSMGLHQTTDSGGWSSFDEFAQLFVADMVATMTGENAENVRRLKEEYRPDLKGGFEFVDTRRNVNQIHAPAVREMLDTLVTDFGIELPDYRDQGFYAAQLVATPDADQAA